MADSHSEITRKYLVSVAEKNKATTPDALVNLHQMALDDLTNVSGVDLTFAMQFAMKESKTKNVQGK